MRRALAVLAVASAIAAACSSFSSADAPPTPDAGDASPDGVSPPPPTLEDAGGDAVGPACDAGVNIVCENFDQAATSLDVQGVTFGAGGTIDLVASPHVSAPHAALVALAPDSGFSATAVLVRELAATGDVSKLTCDFELYVVAGDMGPVTPNLFEVDLTPIGSSELESEKVTIYFDQGGVGLHLYVAASDKDGGFPGGDQDIGAITMSAWWHVRLTVGGGNVGVVASPLEGGAPIPANVAVPTPESVSAIHMTAGLFQGSATTGSRIALDDIACALTP